MLTKFLIYLTIFSAPLYLVRFSIFKIPTNVLDILMFITIITASSKIFKKRNLLNYNRASSKKITILFSIIILTGIIISTVVSGNNSSSWGIIKSWFILPMLFSLVVSINFKTISDKQNILRIVFYSIGFIALVSLGYYFANNLTYDHRLRSFYGSPNQLAMYLSLGLIIALLKTNILNLKYFKKNKQFIFKNILEFFLTIAILISLYLTQSQGAWISIFTTFFILYSIFCTKKKYFQTKQITQLPQIFKLCKNKKIINITLILGIIFILLTIISNRSTLQNIKCSISNADCQTQNINSSFSSRLIIWKSSLKILKDNWLWGIGPGNFQNKYLEYQKYFPPYQEWAVPQPHNIYLAFWLQAGLFGFIGFIGLILVYCRNLFFQIKNSVNVNKKKLAIILIALIFMILIHGLVDTPVWKNDLALIFWIIIIAL